MSKFTKSVIGSITFEAEKLIEIANTYRFAKSRITLEEVIRIRKLFGPIGGKLY